jgi:hypothetical protein
MIQPARPDGYMIAKAELIAGFDRIERYKAVQFIDRDRKVWGLHLVGENIMQAKAAVRGTVDAEPVLFAKCRHEERQALDVIPMIVRQEDAASDLCTLFSLEMLTEADNPRTSVDDKQMTGAFDAQAGRIAADR